MFMGLNIVYNRPLTNEYIGMYTLATLIYLLVSTAWSMLVIFISELCQRLQVAEQSSINLLNGMHEGILILSHTTS